MVHKINNFLRKFVLTFCFLTGGAVILAQSPVATLSAETDTLSLGAQTTLTLKVEAASGSRITLPVFADTLTRSIEIISQSETDSSLHKSQGIVTFIKTFVITSFDTGFQIVPPIIISAAKPRQFAIERIESNPLLLYVKGVSIDSDKDIMDIKAPLKAPPTLGEVLSWVIPILVLVAIAIGLWYRFKGRKRPVPVSILPQKPKIPPHQRALEDLQVLQAKQLWEKGFIKEYHSELTEIVRRYIEDRFGFLALEMTSGEIMLNLAHEAVPTISYRNMDDLLARADLVKFAKSQPLPDEHERSMLQAGQFVKDTIPAPIAPAEKEQPAINEQAGKEEHR